MLLGVARKTLTCDFYDSGARSNTPHSSVSVFTGRKTLGTFTNYAMSLLPLLVAAAALAPPARLASASARTSSVRRAHVAVRSTVKASAADAVVIGGGPAGLATAWVLAHRGFSVTVLERRSEPSPYEAQRAYLYLVDQRGQRFTDMAGLTDELASAELSVSSTNYTVTRCLPDGERVEVSPPILEPVRGRPS